MLTDFTYPSVFQRDFYGNRTKWSSVRSVIIRVLQPLPTAKQESDLFNHEYDYRLNWTPLSPITIFLEKASAQCTLGKVR